MTHTIALLPGDGVGPEVTQEARRVVDALGLNIDWLELDWGADYWRAQGVLMPDDGLEVLQSVDAVLLGAIGDPEVPDHVSLWGSILKIRQGLDLWANVRPARLLPGIASPVRDTAGGGVDMLVIRENTEGEYAGVGGRAHVGRPGEVGIEVSVFTRHSVERIITFAFDRARERRGLLTSATKSNASRYGYVLWDEVASEVAASYPDVRYERVLVDALAARMVQKPASLDVVVASNLFADILTDLAAAIQGGMGVAASANYAPDRRDVGVFEPVHGSAPDIAKQGIANPVGAIWSASLMLEYLGESEAASAVMQGLESVCRDGPRTRDLGGDAPTTEVGEAVARVVSAAA
jgi:tartrate dehydrogenase/decarboxylase / D-malate dehydrogenase